jgi:hypothetical protein
VVQQRRWQAVGEGRESDQNDCIGAIEPHFGSWLSATGGHPLQKLWRRSDSLSSGELVLFGDALRKIEPIAPDWLHRQIAKVKSDDENNRRGAVAEILCAAMFCTGHQTVTPAKESQPGYDLMVDNGAGATVYVSVKSFGMSYHEAKFRREAQRLEKEFEAALKQLGETGVGMMVSAVEYPSDGNWAKLRHFVTHNTPALCREMHAQRSVSKWSIVPFSITSEQLSRRPNHTSYQIIATSPFHPNEKRNLYSKLDGAASQISRSLPVTEGGRIRMVFAQMPQTSAIGDYAEWANQYLEDNKKSADIVVIYRISSDDTMRLNHHVVTRWSQDTSSLLTRRPLATSVILGLVGEAPPTDRILIGTMSFELHGKYSYQSGHLFPLIRYEPGSQKVVNLSSPHRGLRQHAVLAMDDGELALQGLFSPDGLLKLIS